MTDKKAPPRSWVISVCYINGEEGNICGSIKSGPATCDEYEYLRGAGEVRVVAVDAFEEMKERAENKQTECDDWYAKSIQDYNKILRLSERIGMLRAALECYNAGDLTPAARDALAEDDEAAK